MKVKEAKDHTVTSIGPGEQIGAAAEAMKRDGGFIPEVGGDTLVVT